MSALGSRNGGLTYARMRNAVRRDAYSDYLPLVAWEPETEAFLCIDDCWGHAWEIVPTAYMFAHVQGALQGLFNINFPPVAPDKADGFAVTTQGNRAIADNLTEGVDPRGRPYYWIGPVR